MSPSIHITLIMHAILTLEQTDSQRLSVAHHSHMVIPDWIQILRKATPTCVKRSLYTKRVIAPKIATFGVS